MPTIFIVLWVASLVLGLWMIVRVWRGSALMGIFCLLVPGAILIALIKNWGDPDTDIKVPFLLSIGLAVMLYFSATNMAGDEFGFNADGSIAFDDEGFGADAFDYSYLAEQYTEEEREQLRRDDPQLAMLLDQAENPEQGAELTSERWESTVSAATSSSVEDTDAVNPVEQKRRDRRAAASAMRQSGPIEIGPAYASLQTPAHFRFVSAPRLQGAARLHQRTLGKNVVGWVVHERVSLDKDLAWFAEISFRPVGHLQANGVSNSAELQQAVSALGGKVAGDGMFAPSWSSRRSVMTWTQSVAGSSAVEAIAALPLRHGVLSYVVRVPSADERELALRTARLLASETRVSDGWRYADAPVDTPTKGPTFAQWVAGVAAAVAAEASAESG